jgi:AcrR family transcriptional regulator
VPRPSRPRETYHHGDLRTALLAAALELVDSQGPDVLTMREVCRRVGVNHRAAYRHFADKTSLLAAVAEQGYLDLLATIEAALLAAGKVKPERRLECIGLAYVAFALDHPAHYGLMFGRRLNEDSRFPELEAIAARAYGLLAGELRAGQVAGAFGAWPLREAVFSLWSLTHGFASLTLARRIKVKRPLLEAYSAQILAPFIAGLKR